MIGVLLRAVGIWLLLTAVAIGNGTIRAYLWTPRLGDAVGHVLSTVLLCVLILLVTRITIRWVSPRNAVQAFVVGVEWITLTVLFEFLAGHYVFGHPWERLLADYDLARGRVWILVLLTTLAAPLWAFHIAGRGRWT